MIREGELARDLSEVRLHALDYLLMITAGRKSSDPRDRIYALYGLIPALSERFPTDYSKTEKQVVLEAISSVVQNRCRYLWINFRLRQDRFTSKALPSWCPDFDRPYQYFRPTVTCEALNFSSSSMGVNRISADLTTCHLWSWNLGYCKVIGRIGLGNHVEKAEALRSTNARLFKPARELWAFLVGLDTHGNAMAQEYRQRFARLAVSDLEGHDQVSDEELFDALEAVSIDARKVVTELPVKPAFDLVYRIQATREAVTCVVTSHGCVALTPIDTEDNDLIILPRHPTPPMVLRKEYSDLSHSDQEFYLMTGPAQIDILGSKGPHVDDAVSIVQQFGVTEYLLH
ncbi:hypothetical protein G7054_g6024 [Neopestalotiopsis clavispora]|nr:hypothetical protein G7054_g6024 [Neopestalotiopsis clavispora]